MGDKCCFNTKKCTILMFVYSVYTKTKCRLKSMEKAKRFVMFTHTKISLPVCLFDKVLFVVFIRIMKILRVFSRVSVCRLY